MTEALDGVRVLDFGQYLAGPLTAMLLADQGADVVRIDPPSGPRWTEPANATLQRGKRRVRLDLKDAAGRDAAIDLARRADVVVENFRPGIMDRLGLGHDQLAAVNPRLVYCSIPGFASDDPRAGVRAWEGVIGAATATYTPAPDAQGERPYLFTPIPISSVFGALVASLSIGGALVEREASGRGQRIEVPLFDATFTAIGARGGWMERPLRAPARITPYVNQYQCADGRWLQLHAINRRFVMQFLGAAGVEQWADDGLADLVRLVEDAELRQELLGRMERLFRERPAHQWEDRIAAAGTPAAVVHSTEEWLHHPQALGSGAVTPVDDPEYGSTLQPGLQARLSACSVTPRPGRRRDDTPIAELRGAWETAAPPAPTAGGGGPNAGSAALSGVRVLDLTLMLAGPTCGRTLAEFGADVIKIDDPNREGGVRFHYFTNRGKRSILLDLKRDEGREIFWRLLEQSDVVVENFRKGVTERLGISYEEARARKPDIIYVSLNAYGHEGPWAGRPGWEQLAQASTGMQERLGGGGRPRTQPDAVTDYGSGLSGAFGAMLALYHRRRTGEGQHVFTSLALAGGLMQVPYMLQGDFDRRAEPRGPDADGFGPLQRLFATADGAMFVGATSGETAALATVAGLSGVDVTDEAALSARLAERFAEAPTVEWVRRLGDAGIGAHELVTVDELMQTSWVRDHGLSLTRPHGSFGLVRTTGPAPRLSRTPVDAGAPAPQPGSDGRSVLDEIGMLDRLDELTAGGILKLEGEPAL